MDLGRSRIGTEMCSILIQADIFCPVVLAHNFAGVETAVGYSRTSQVSWILLKVRVQPAGNRSSKTYTLLKSAIVGLRSGEPDADADADAYGIGKVLIQGYQFFLALYSWTAPCTDLFFS